MPYLSIRRFKTIVQISYWHCLEELCPEEECIVLKAKYVRNRESFRELQICPAVKINFDTHCACPYTKNHSQLHTHTHTHTEYIYIYIYTHTHFLQDNNQLYHWKLPGMLPNLDINKPTHGLPKQCCGTTDYRLLQFNVGLLRLDLHFTYNRHRTQKQAFRKL